MVKFIDDTHQYFNEQDEQYISVSGIAHLLEPKTDWEAVKKKKAKKEGVTVQFLTDKWEMQKEKGSGAGKIYHSYRENDLLGMAHPEFYGVPCSMRPCEMVGGWKYSLIDTKLQNNTIYPEAIVYDHESRVAGQSDKVIVVNNTIHVEDYKTDKSIERKSFSSQWVKARKLLSPVSHLDHCNFNLYAIKMSMYMYLLWKANKNMRTGDLVLEWVQFERDEDGCPILAEDGKPIVINTERIHVPYLRNDVKKILEYYKDGRLKAA